MKTMMIAAVLCLAGCGSMNSVTKNDSTKNHKRACACPGTEMSCCARNPDGTTPCSPSECTCQASAMAPVVKSGSCCK